MNTSSKVILILFFLFFIIKCFSIDPDFGWHLQMGNYILSHGIPQTDPFSYSMPTYAIIDHAWLTDVITSLIFSITGMTGIVLFFATVGITSVWLSIREYKQKMIFFPLLLTGATLLFIMGVRPQVISWLLFSLLLFLLQSKTSKRYIFIPLLLTLWANIHASFPVGLLTIIMYVLVEHLATKKIELKKILLIYTSTIATLINPYGIRLWQEIWITISQQEKIFLLMDWYPGILVPYFPFWITLILSIYFLFRWNKHYTLFQKVLFVPLLLLGLASVVDIPYVALFSLPILVTGYEEEAKKHNHFLQRKFFRVATIGLIFLQILPLFHQYAYPEKAVQYLKQHQPSRNIFTDFNWGGYLVWQMPEKKVFIDGQMSNWKSSHANKNESTDALKEYYLFTNRYTSIDDFTQKYAIETFVLPPNFGDWENKFHPYDVKGMKKYPPLTKQLAEGKWKIVYQDETAIIYQKR